MRLLGGKAFSSKISAIKDAKTSSTSTVKIDWEGLYPYNTVVDEVKVDNMGDLEESTVTKLTNKISKLSTLGNNWSKLIYGYDDIARIGYVIYSRLTDPSIGNTYNKLKNGYWITFSLEMSFDNAKSTIAPYVSLNNYLKAMDYYGIDYVDLREELHNDSKDHYSMFYITDHHWTVESGLWASSIVAEKMSETLGVEIIDPYSLGDYYNVTYPKAEFGSMGNGVTHFVEEPEDFTIPYPNFETNYRLEVPNKGIDDTGAFREIFVDEEGINELAEAGGGAAYGKIIYGNPPFEKITNYDNPNGPKVLMIRDSFSNIVAPYLAASCSELIMLDTRANSGNFQEV